MKQILHIAIPAILAAMFHSCGIQNEYYFSPSGNDEASGNSPMTALRTIEKFNSMNFKPGDRVLFEGGETFEGSLRLDINDGGDPGNPLLITSYGNARAIIRSGTEDGLYAENTSGVQVCCFDFRGAGANIDAQFSGIHFHTDLDSVKPEYIRIERVMVSGYRWDGIAITAEREGESGFRDVRIKDCSVHDIGDRGITCTGGQPEGDWAHRDLSVVSCRVYDVRGIPGKKGHSGNGIMLSSLDGGSIEYCIAHDNGEFSDDPDSGGPIGIWAWDCRNVVIQHCESYDNRTGNQSDGGGFDLDGGCVDCIMQYNYSHGNYGAGYGIYQYSGAREFRNNTVRYNISENDGIRNRYGGINLWSTSSSGGIRGTRIYNNTIYVGDMTRGAAIEDLPDEADTCYIYNTEIYNNIFVGTPGKPLVDIPNPSVEWVFAGNCYYTYRDNVGIKWGDETYSSLEEWKQATGQENLEGTETGLETNPRLAGVGSLGTIGDAEKLQSIQSYQLRENSPLIDRGLNLRTLFGLEPGPTDFFGTGLSEIQAFDIGAHEFLEE